MMDFGSFHAKIRNHDLVFLLSGERRRRCSLCRPCATYQNVKVGEFIAMQYNQVDLEMIQRCATIANNARNEVLQ